MREVVWTREFDSGPRHCWELNNGKRQLDVAGFSYDNENNYCEELHIITATRVGKVSWLRFIHAFDGDFGPVKIVPSGEVTSEGIPAYCEVYEDFKVFLNVKPNVAVIECFNPDLVEKCIEADNEVYRQYEVIRNG